MRDTKLRAAFPSIRPGAAGVFRSIVTTIAAGTFAACAASEITGVSPARGSGRAGALAAAGATLVECPSTSTTSATATVTPLGGVVSVGGTSIIVPEGALLDATSITVTVPASTYMEVDIRAAGLDHFTFQVPVTVVVSYDRCTRSDIDKTALSAWYIDSNTKALLEPMGGVDDKLSRTVTFTTGHLSGYALAN